MILSSVDIQVSVRIIKVMNVEIKSGRIGQLKSWPFKRGYGITGGQ